MSLNHPTTYFDNTDPISILLSKCALPKDDADNLIRLRLKLMDMTRTPIENRTLSAKMRIGLSPDAINMDVWYKIIFYLTTDADGMLCECAAMLRRMTDEEVLQKEIVESFSNDRNPRIFNSRISRMIQKYPDSKLAFVQFDIKNFKFINENYGEDFGNDVLNNIYNILKLYVSDTFIFSRLTADVFMFVTSYEDRMEIFHIIDELEPKLNHYQEIGYRICFGINFATDLTKQPRYNGDCAAIARFSCKQDATSRYIVYMDELRQNQRHRKDIEESLRSAIKNNEFVVYLQPKYNLDTRKAVGAEALVRWIRKDGIMVPPGDFIPTAEENGFVKQIDYYVWERTCQILRGWIDEKRTPLPISINVSRSHLEHFDFIDFLNTLIEKYRIPKELLEIEITETIQSDNDDNAILKLKDCGYRLLMDDFGTGYSSLKMINETPFDVLKIDRSFLLEFVNSQRGKKILSHTINMSKDIGIDMIAEGIETELQEKFLLENGCMVGQGYLFCRPIPLEEFNEKYMSE